MPSEDEVQGKLNLASATNGFVHVAQTIRAVVEASVRPAAGCGQRRRTDRGEAVVILVLRNVVDGHVEAGRVGDVENVKAELRFIRSVTLVFFTKETSMHRCQAWRKILRCPVVKLVHPPRRRAPAAEW